MSTPRFVILDRSATTVVYDTKHLIEPIAKVVLNDQPSSAVWAWADCEPNSPAHSILFCADRPEIRDVRSIPKSVPAGYWVLRIGSGHHFGAPAVKIGTPAASLAAVYACDRAHFVAAIFKDQLKPVTLRA